MDVKERKPYRSLTRRRDTERRYTSSSADSDDSKLQPKSYSSSETLKAYDQDSRLSYCNRVKDMVHQEVDEFCRSAGSFTLQELGLGEVTPPHGTLYRTDIGLPHCGYSMTSENDADNEADCVLSPEQPVRLWTRNTKSGRSSCLSSRANSNLTLTDTEHENTENDLQDVELMNPALEQCFPTTVLGDSQQFQFSGYTHRSTGPPLHCSSASSTPIEQTPSPPPTPGANGCQRRLIGQPAQHSQSGDFAHNSLLVKSGSANLGVSANDQSLGLQNHLRLRTPPPPLSHPPNPHHAASINSLNRGNFTPRSNPSPAPTDHSLSGEPPGSAQEAIHGQDNWLLNSNIPLETRRYFKTLKYPDEIRQGATFLKTVARSIQLSTVLTVSARRDELEYQKSSRFTIWFIQFQAGGITLNWGLLEDISLHHQVLTVSARRDDLELVTTRRRLASPSVVQFQPGGMSLNW
ncbi:teneurin-4-like [Anomaloglossus baeobatrachus]